MNSAALVSTAGVATVVIRRSLGLRKAAKVAKVTVVVVSTAADCLWPGRGPDGRFLSRK